MEPWYRRNAGIVVCNPAHKVLVCQRIDIANCWQFPQGGIEKGESVKEAALRELREETSITKVKHIISLDTPARYTFPPHIMSSMQKRGYTNAGQDIFWSMFLFEGSDDEINLQTPEPEFKSFKWVTLQEAYDLCVEFKKPSYAVALQKFTPYLSESI